MSFFHYHRYHRTEPTNSSASNIGEGAYGVVYKGRDLVTNDDVALKKIRLEGDDEGIPATALREIIVLKQLRHDNVVHLRDVVLETGRLYLVFELVHMDLKKLMDSYDVPLQPSLVRSYVAQILDGLAYIHSMGIMHRDLKPQNLLVTKSGSIKLADFGLARTFTPSKRELTVEVITRWYRAPEILLGCSTYTSCVDVWSVGCIMAEMVRIILLGLPLPDLHKPALHCSARFKQCNCCEPS
jgi:serine/threonine protein kinase